MPDPELIPCPFCGEPARLFSAAGEIEWRGGCITDCSARGPVRQTPADAAEVWNAAPRPPRQDLDAVAIRASMETAREFQARNEQLQAENAALVRQATALRAALASEREACAVQAESRYASYPEGFMSDVARGAGRGIAAAIRARGGDE